MSMRANLKCETRDLRERRRIKTFPPPRYLLFGRRKTVRRASDLHGKYFTDYRRPGLSALIIFIIIMCVLDYGFTLAHLNRGAVELNPLMAMAIDISDSYFFLIKYLITAVGLFVLYLCKDFFPIHEVLFAISILYSSLILYHIAGFYSMPQ